MLGRGKINVTRTVDRSRVTNTTLGTDPNSLLAYDPVLELHHPIISNRGGTRGRLERDRKREKEI